MVEARSKRPADVRLNNGTVHLRHKDVTHCTDMNNEKTWVHLGVASLPNIIRVASIAERSLGLFCSTHSVAVYLRQDDP